MKKAVIFQQSEILCALGDLNEGSKALHDGKSAIIAGPCFSTPVAFAPFENVSYRKLHESARFLKSRIDLSLLQGQKVLFIYCAAKGDLSALESESRDTQSLSPVLGEQARAVSAYLGLEPFRIMAISSACASGAVAVEVAKEFLERELFSTAVLFGFDVISNFVTSGFYALNALSPTGARPFDESRNGLSLGDGVALTVLTRREPEPGEILIAGTGSSNDANHRTGPSRTGEGLFRAAAAALNSGSSWGGKIGAVKCHGTATVYNDAMEAKAITRLFQAVPPCFSMKGAIGHTSGAGSLIEILLATRFLKQRIIPPTAGFEKRGVEENIPVSNSAQTFGGDSMLCLSAGFGGLNAAVVIKEYCR